MKLLADTQAGEQRREQMGAPVLTNLMTYTNMPGFLIHFHCLVWVSNHTHTNRVGVQS